MTFMDIVERQIARQEIFINNLYYLFTGEVEKIKLD